MLKVYQQIYADQKFKYIKSSLPYCFTEAKTAGHYFIYIPNTKSKGTILFLHGYGGNFLFYIYLFKKAFPEYRIIAPTYGLSWNKQGINYLNDMLKNIEEQTGKIDKMWLIAISAGGPVGFDFYNLNMQKISGYICLASSPRNRQLTRINKAGNILMINGTADKRFPIKTVNRYIKKMGKRVKYLKHETIAADHFFLLSHQTQTFNLIKAFISTQE